MICPTAVEAAKRIVDAAMKRDEITKIDAVAVAVELLAAADADMKRNRDGVREIAAIVSTWEAS